MTMKTITIEGIEYALTPVEKKYKRWRAEKWQTYYIIDPDWDIAYYCDDNDIGDNSSYNIGNYFKTEEEASQYKQEIEQRYQEMTPESIEKYMRYDYRSAAESWGQAVLSNAIQQFNLKKLW